MAESVSLADYKEALLFLTTAGVVAPLLRKFRINQVLGFIGVGMLLGPFALGRLTDDVPVLRYFSLSKLDDIAHLAEFGVVFLLFMIGLELSFERLSRMRRFVFGLGAVQVVASTLVIGLAAWLAGVGAGAAATIGAALALSSTAIVIPVLAEARRLNSNAGRITFSVLLFQDLAVAPLLVMVTMLGGAPGGAAAPAAGLLAALWTLAPAALGLAALVGVGRLALRPLFHVVAAAGTTEFFMAACLLVVLAAGVAAAAAGLSMALGAFIAGLLLAETEFRREIEVTIEPFKGLLLGLFFVSVGASLDLAQLVGAFWSTLAIAAGLIVGKAALFYLAARLFGATPGAARESALLLGPGGEFAFVLLTAAVAGGVVAPSLGGHIILAVTLSMLAIPFLAMLARRLGRTPATGAALASADADAPAIDGAGRVIVVGYGRVGRLVADMLTAHKIPLLAIDEDANIVACARRDGLPIYWGNATRPDFLRRCDIAHARALVVTINSPRRVEEIVRVGRAERADLTIVARARDAAHATLLYELGATDAIPETIEASLQLSEAVLVDIGVPMGYVIASIHEKRDEFRAMLQPTGEAAREKRAMRLSTRVKDMQKKKPPKEES